MLRFVDGTVVADVRCRNSKRATAKRVGLRYAESRLRRAFDLSRFFARKTTSGASRAVHEDSVIPYAVAGVGHVHNATNLWVVRPLLIGATRRIVNGLA